MRSVSVAFYKTMKGKFVIILCVLLSLSLNSYADTAEFELAAGKKILHVSQMRIPGDVTLSELLQMFPELTARDDAEALSRFDIQVDDVSVGSSKYTMMKQLRCCDIKDIELSQFPSASQQNNGQGGVINVKLLRTPDGLSGSAMLEASTTWNVAPAVSLSYTTDKLNVSGYIVGQYYQPKNNLSEVLTESASAGLNRSFIEDTYRYGTELASASLVYTPDSHHKLKAWIWESYEKDYHAIAERFDSRESNKITNTTKDDDKVSLSGGVNYKYSFNRGFAETQLIYEYTPDTYHMWTDGGAYININLDDYYRPHMLNMFAKGGFQLIPTAPGRKCELETGLNLQYNPSEYSYKEKYTGLSEKEEMSFSLSPLYLSPYLQIDSQFGPVFLKAAVRYQYYRYNVKASSGQHFHLPQHDVTATLNAGWNIARGHNLTLTVDKALRRPDNQHVYPFDYYDPNQEALMRGNASLKPEDIYTVALDYQYDWSNDEHRVLAGAGLRYYHTADIICDAVIDYMPSFANNGHSNIFGANFLGTYSYGPFHLSVNGNLFRNWNTIGGTTGKYFSYNIAVIPRLSFNGDWRIAARVEYNSKEENVDKFLGDYVYSEVRLSKGWKNWTFYTKLGDNFHRLVEDIDYSSAETKTTWYYLHFPGFGLGASVRF